VVQVQILLKLKSLRSKNSKGEEADIFGHCKKWKGRGWLF